MKKLLGILVLGLLLSTPAYSWCIWNCASKQDVDSARGELRSLQSEIDELRRQTERAQSDADDAMRRAEEAEDRQMDCELLGDCL